MDGALHLFDSRLSRRVDALYAVLVASDSLQFFPEMLEIFGQDSVIKFMDIFAGQTVVVPPRDVLEAKIRDVTLLLEHERQGKSVDQLAKEYSMKKDDVIQKIQSVRDCLGKVGVSVLAAGAD